MTSDSGPAPTPRSPAVSPWSRRARRFLRLLLMGVALGLIVAVGGIWLVTRSWFLVDRVTPFLEQRLGARVTIGEAAYEGSGVFTFRNVRVRVPDIAGAGGEICHVDRARVAVNLDRLLSGEVALEDVVVDGLLVRLSEDVRSPGTFSFMGLKPDLSTEATQQQLPPRVQLNTAVIEVGEHDGVAFEARGSRALSGSMQPDPGHPEAYSVTLVEVDERGQVLADGGLLVDGEWHVPTNAHRFHVVDVELSDRAYDMCPSLVRLWWDRMELDGRLREVEIGWSAAEGIQLDLRVEDVGLTLPIETDLWDHYRGGRIEPSESRPRMHVSGGTIQISRRQASLANLEGLLVSAGEEAVVGVPYRVDLSIDDLGVFDWSDRPQAFEAALATAPFEMTIHSDEFRVGESEATGSTPTVVLPSALARVLERFSFSAWALSTRIQVTRAAPSAGPGETLVAAEIESEGEAFITDASGTYERFPYPLDDVEAYIEFSHEAVVIRHLDATGSQDARVRLSGEIRPPSRHAQIALQLTARDVPVDDRLRSALRPGQQRIFDLLMHRDSYDALVAAGALDAPHGLIEDEPFALGGTVDLDLRIDRVQGEGNRAVTSGLITVQSVGILDERFPYPLRVDGGLLDWHADGIDVRLGPDGEGIPVRTPGGGRGELRGSINIVRTAAEPTLRPDFTLTVEDDRPNPLLIGAVPPSASERERGAAPAWPGTLAESGRWLEELQLTGVLDSVVHIFSPPEGPIGYDIDVRLREGTARPAPAIARLLGVELEPDEWRIDECTGRLRARPDAIELEHLTGRRAGGRITIDGRLDLRPESSSVAASAQLESMPLDRSLLKLLPERSRPRVEELWTRFAPSGRFDAELIFRPADDPGAEGAWAFRLRPQRLELLAGTTPVVLTGEGGHAWLREGRLEFDDLALAVETSGEPQGVITLNGGLDLAEPGDQITGRWDDGRFESALIPAILRAAGAMDAATRYEAFEPHGLFDGVFRFRPAHAETPADYRIELEPSVASFTHRDTVIHLELSERARVFVEPGVVRLHDLSARHVAGVVDFSGVIRTGPSFLMTLDLTYLGRFMSQPVLVFLPDAVVEALELIELQEGGDSRVEDGRLVLEALPDGGWDVSFAGRVSVEDASLTAGVPVRGIDGDFDLVVHRSPARGLEMDLAVSARRVTVYDQPLVNASGTIRTADGGTRLVVRDFRAHGRTGVLTLESEVGLGADAAYAFTMRFVGLPLGDLIPGGDDTPATPTGEVFARLDVSGVRGDPGARLGRGSARVLGGRLARVPLVLQLVNLVQLTVPTAGIDYAEAEFFLAGDRVVFEEMLFESTLGATAPMSLRGVAELDLRTREINGRFHSRSALAVLSDIVGGIGDQLVAIEITGTLSEPKGSLLALPGRRRPMSELIVTPPLVKGLADGTPEGGRP
ncbi:MAG: hypothetical protein HKN62_11180 [Phycisphaerales bacterium]|nr:hypothetical protein [Phycisphaerales bacterium]